MRQKTGSPPLKGAAFGRGTTFVCLQDVILGPQPPRPLTSLPSSPASPQANFEKKKSPQPVPFWWFAVYCQDSHSSPSLCHAHTSIINRCRPVVLPTTAAQATTQNLCGINSSLRQPHEHVQKQQVPHAIVRKNAINYAEHHPEHQLKTVSMSKNHSHTRPRHLF